ncbi:MAG: LCP family protein [Clostridia bacterium]|nr:LCP family protein [Clostridia bacterium]
MKKGNNKPLRFDTRKNARSMRRKRFAAAFSCFFVLLGGISFLLLLRYYNFDLSAIGNPAEETTVEETTIKPEPQVSGSYRYLLLCTADSSNELRFAAVLNADMEALELSVTPLDPTQSLSYGGCTGNLSAQLDFGGEKQLAAAIEAATGIKTDKFIRSTDSSFKSLINSFGGFETTVEKAIDVRSDRLTAIIGAGRQTMTGDTLLKYLRYYENEPNTQAEIIADIIEQEITPANFKKADSHYTRVINLVKSDISVVDFASVKTGIDALLYSGEAVKVSVK